ncbi:hypothetical protein [Nioella sp.]|uniref:hypothetical protein n=2 Tax=Nioella TaxID=1775424 RepID=UPI003B5212D9
MTRSTKNSLFKCSTPIRETLMDKTTRVVKQIIDEETEQRKVKTSRLRKARLEKEEGAAVEATAPKPAKAPKKPRATAAK